MSSREIVLWLDERWYSALNRHLKDETVEEHLENVLDELCNQLPEREYKRIICEIWEETQKHKQAQEAARTWSAYHVVENGEERYFKVSPGEELLDTAKKLRGYLKNDSGGGKFIRQFPHGEAISPEEYQDMMHTRMENTGKVTGVFDIDFDKREFSAVNITDGWKSWAMQDVSTAVYQAFRKGHIDTEERYHILLEHLDGRKITTAGHLSAQNFVFGDEIIMQDGKLNFYIETWFDVDKVFGTNVLTDQNNDWLNVYANYDLERGEVCDTLELTLCKDTGRDEQFVYSLNAAEKEVLLQKMNAFCRQQWDKSLAQCCAEYLAEQQAEQRPVQEMQL